MRETTFKVEVKPEVKNIRLRLIKWNQKSLDQIHFRLVEGANRIRNHMINAMYRTPKTGKKYKRDKKWHIASSPGMAPAVDSGQLIRSFVMEVRTDEVEVGVKSGAPYAKYLETGTKKMMPRPFMKPAADAEIPRIRRKILWDIRKVKV